MEKIIQLIAKGESETVSTVHAGAGEPLVITAEAGINYELRDAATKVAPQQIMLMRKGQDLMVKVADGAGAELSAQPDIVIKGYYDASSGNLVGLSEDGNYYDYVPQEGDSDLFAPNIDDGASSYQSLGYSEVVADPVPAPVVVVEEVAAEPVVAAAAPVEEEGYGWWPWALGALALLGLGLAMAGGDDDNKDTRSPAPDMTPETDTGISNTDNYTADSTPDFLIPAPPAGSTPNLYVDGVLVPSTYDPVAMTLTPDSPIADGSHTVTWTVTDGGGAESAQSKGLGIVIDTTAPTTTASITAIDVDSGSVTDDFITNDTDGLTVTAMLSAALVAGERLLYSNDDGATWMDISSSVSGTAVSYDDAALTSTSTIRMKVEDAAGNDGAETSQLVTIDTTPSPTAPSVAILVDANNDGYINAAELGTATESDVEIGIPTDAQVGDVITVTNELTSAVIATYTVDGTTVMADSIQTITGVALPAEGETLTITTATVDIVGNAGPAGSDAVTVDTIAPTTTVTIDAITEDNGIASDDFLTNDSDGLTVSGTLSAALLADERLMYSNDDGATWIDITSSVTGTAVSYDDAALTATATIRMRVEDLAGNPAAEDSQLVTIDTTPPTATVTIDSITVDSGTAADDFITNDNDGLTVAGTLSAGLLADERLMYSNDDGATWTDISSSVTGAAVNYDDAALTSTATIRMRVEDDAGNGGTEAVQLVTIDTTPPPTAASVAIVLDADNSGSISSTEQGGATTTDITVGIPTDAQDGDVVTVTNALTSEEFTYTVGTDVAAGDTVTISSVLPVGSEVLTVTTTITDLAGNTGPTSADSAMVNVAPAVSASQGALLGLVSANALGLLDTSAQLVAAADENNDIETVVVTYSPLLAVGSFNIIASSDMAAELGLNISYNNTIAASEITITNSAGGAMDNIALNELLSTIVFENPALVISVAGTLTIDATDTSGVTSSDSSTDLLNLGLLSTQSADVGVQEGTAAGEILTGTADADRLYGYGGDDTLDGLAGDDVLRGGAGSDTLNGGDNNDLLIGGSGADTLNGDAGDDMLAFDAEDTIDGGTGADTLYVIGAAVSIDLTAIDDAQIIGIDTIDLTGTGDNALTLEYSDLLALNETDTLYVTGNGGDTVTLTGETFTGTQDVGGVIYNTYDIGGTADADIWVQQDITVI